MHVLFIRDFKSTHEPLTAQTVGVVGSVAGRAEPSTSHDAAPGSGASPLASAAGMGRGAAAGGAAAGGASAGGAAARVSATGSKLWDLATRVDTVGADNHTKCSRCAWPCVFLRSRRADAALTGPFLRPPASPLAGAALQALRELGIDCSDRNNVVNERNGKFGSTGGCSDETSQRRGLS
jgi:hypothetical protein